MRKRAGLRDMKGSFFEILFGSSHCRTLLGPNQKTFPSGKMSRIITNKKHQTYIESNNKLHRCKISSQILAKIRICEKRGKDFKLHLSQKMIFTHFVYVVTAIEMKNQRPTTIDMVDNRLRQTVVTITGLLAIAACHQVLEHALLYIMPPTPTSTNTLLAMSAGIAAVFTMRSYTLYSSYNRTLKRLHGNIYQN